MNISKYLRARKDRALFEKLVFALIPRTDYNPFGAARELFELITGRVYNPSQYNCRDARTSQHKQKDR